MPPTINDLFNAVRDLMTEHAALFESTGLTLFKAFATILIVWFGLQTALAAASGASGVRFDKFASLIMTITFGFAMMTFYSHPIPGFGISFYHLIVDEGLQLANQLNHALVQDVWDRLTTVYAGLEHPGLSATINPVELVEYAIVVVALLLAQGSIFAVIAFGYVASAVAVLVGPIFIPFFVVPHMEWLFWNWFKSLIQYAFYPVIANAYLYVFGTLLIHFFDAFRPPYNGAQILVLFFPMVMLLITFVYGIAKIPSLVNSIFSGRSGESAWPK